MFNDTDNCKDYLGLANRNDYVLRTKCLLKDVLEGKYEAGYK